MLTFYIASNVRASANLRAGQPRPERTKGLAKNVRQRTSRGYRMPCIVVVANQQRESEAPEPRDAHDRPSLLRLPRLRKHDVFAAAVDKEMIVGPAAYQLVSHDIDQGMGSVVEPLVEGEQACETAEAGHLPGTSTKFLSK